MASTLKVQNIAHTGGTNAIAIDSSGRVTRPVLPAWRVGRTANATISSGHGTTTVIDFNETSNTTRNLFIQGGCTISSGVVTVPVAGIYHVETSLRLDDIGSGYVVVRIMRNSDTDSQRGTYMIEGAPASNYFTIQDSTIFKLDASDTLKVDYYVSADTSFQINVRSYFSGYLVG